MALQAFRVSTKLKVLREIATHFFPPKPRLNSPCSCISYSLQILMLLDILCLMMLSCKTARKLSPNKSERFQFMSDLHLEAKKEYSTLDFPCQAPYLILAGDIGRLCEYQLYLEFPTKQCGRFLKVFLVLGNHEFFRSSRAEGLRLAVMLEHEAALQGKLVILNRRKVDLSENLTILGCTLHSHIAAENYTSVQTRVKDFIRIKDWTIEDHNAEHRADVDWL
jgi:hypothetical protein